MSHSHLVAEKKILSLNTNQIEKEQIYDGFYGVCTNLEDNAEEIIKLAVLENKVKSVSGDANALTNEELKTEIGKKLTEQGYTVSGSTVTYYGDKTIDIENYLEKESKTYTAYNVGDQVTVGGENFYVIKASSASEEKVTLLAEKNIDTTTMKQSDSANTIAFSSTNYWKSIEGITYPYNLNGVETSVSTDVINIAKAYGTAKGGEGRLMTVEEALEFFSNIPRIKQKIQTLLLNKIK